MTLAGSFVYFVSLPISKKYIYVFVLMMMTITLFTLAKKIYLIPPYSYHNPFTELLSSNLNSKNCK